MQLMAVHPPLLEPFRRWRPAVELFHASQPWHIASGYGLFRRMTGVGDGGEGARVARPEIELQGSDDGQSWAPYVLKYKPGPLDRRPPWVAPHQPRLDWQMWFAALGSYQGSPWFVHLAAKLLEGQPEVVSLLESVPPQFRERPPRYIRAELFLYDMTQPSWGRRRMHPGGGGRPLEAMPDTSAWWVRAPAGPYLPPLQRNNSSLEAFLQSRGWGRRRDPDLQPPRPISKMLWFFRRNSGILAILVNVLVVSLTAAVVLECLPRAQRQYRKIKKE
uniref:Lipase maturation factor 2 n=1 Tax=Tetraselmis sp. GSL018 TaxID=582737 RepID=A0A061SJ14_9CHLO